MITIAPPSGEGGTQDEQMDRLAATASAGFDHDPTVYSYVLGIGNLVNEQLRALLELERVAISGGGEAFFPQYEGVALTNELIDRLNELAYQAFACEYSIQVDPSEVDFEKVNVQYRFGGREPDLLEYVKTEEECGLNTWHYDNPDAPTRVVLCPEPCAAAQQHEDPEITILFGCPSIPATVE
jgi:hypothetical protein